MIAVAAVTRIQAHRLLINSDMKKQPAKLIVARDTVRVLRNRDLDQARGGADETRFPPTTTNAADVGLAPAAPAK